MFINYLYSNTDHHHTDRTNQHLYAQSNRHGLSWCVFRVHSALHLKGPTYFVKCPLHGRSGRSCSKQITRSTADIALRSLMWWLLQARYMCSAFLGELCWCLFFCSTVAGRLCGQDLRLSNHRQRAQKISDVDMSTVLWLIRIHLTSHRWYDKRHLRLVTLSFHFETLELKCLMIKLADIYIYWHTYIYI